MSHVRHDAIVVCCWDDESIEAAHAKAHAIFDSPTDAITDLPACPVSEILTSPMNGYRSFFVAPDGSKEGWTDSNVGDERREEFIEWLTKSRDPLWNDWVHVRFGDEVEMGYDAEPSALIVGTTVRTPEG